MYSNLFIYVILFLVAILSVRFNIINSIHNFINLQSQNQYFYYIIYLVMVMSFYMNITEFNKFNQKNTLYCIFMILILYFFLLFLLNIVDICLIKSIQVVLPSTRTAYITITLFTILIYLTKYNPNYSINALILVMILLNNNITYSDIYLIVLVHGLFTSSLFLKNLIVKWSHVLILSYMYITIYQIYIFDESILQLPSYGEIIIKLSNQIVLDGSSSIDYKSNFFRKSDGKIYFVQSYRDNFNMFDAEFYKNIFEKKLVILNLQLNEFYSYNLQRLTQLNGLNIFALLALLFVITLNIFFRKNVNSL